MCGYFKAFLDPLGIMEIIEIYGKPECLTMLQ